MRYCLIALFALLAACKPESEPRPEKPTEAVRPTDFDGSKAFRTDNPFVRPMRVPGSSDWLANHEEDGQTFQEWVDSEPNIPDAQRRVIYLQPIGPFEGPRTVDLEQLQRFTTTFFQLPVVVREPLSIDLFPTRQHHGQTQIKTGDILNKLREIVPANAYCVLAVTMTDLYPRDSWNFVFGVASLRDRVGVFSFARYSPQADELSDSQRAMLTLRAYKVLSHEAGHMFGIHHCTAYHCGMNGANHMEETDRAPLYYCPVCLRKLQSAVGFDVGVRDGQLAQVLHEADLWQQANWYQERQEWLYAP